MRASYDACLRESSVALFLSLPFHPRGQRNLFVTGHIAVAIGELVYQVYDPRRLRAGFLLSRMAASDWLYGEGGPWVERDPGSPAYRSVYLYGTCESRRTVVYRAHRRVPAETADRLRLALWDTEERFQGGDITFSLLCDNCSSIVASALSAAGLLQRARSDRVPVRLFKRFVRECPRRDGPQVTKVTRRDPQRFALHRFCVGAGRDPEQALDRWIAREFRRQGGLAHGAP